MGGKPSKSGDQQNAPASEQDLPHIDPQSRLRVRSPDRERPAPRGEEAQNQDRQQDQGQEQELPLSKEELEEAAKRHVKTREETLVKIPNALVHLIDDQNSVLLAEGRFSLVRLLQDGNEVAVFARVGRELQWPILKDEVTTKLDAAHYFFTLRVDPNDNDDDSQGKDAQAGEKPHDQLSYGVTFKVKGNESKLAKLDELLDKYSFFSKPKLVQGDDEQEKEQMVQDGKLGDIEGKTVSAEVVKELETKPSEDKARLYWTAVAPNVEEYNTSIAKGIATGTGHVIRSIFWCSNSTVDQLEKTGKYLKQHTKGYEKPAEISPRAMRNVQRVRRVTQMSEKVARGILTGIITVTGFFTSAAMTSKIGQKFFKMLPGEVALASLDAFGKVFDALEMAGESVLSHATLVTTGVVAHKFGEQAGEIAHEILASVGHVLSTAWVVSKIRNAVNPKQAKNPTSTSSMLKSAAKGALTRRK